MSQYVDGLGLMPIMERTRYRRSYCGGSIFSLSPLSYHSSDFCCKNIERMVSSSAPGASVCMST
uniref:Uncharacterized protein n=1 Tax=Kalanchoe fedtschenkoi TaxID=63787 RepID=A0A7N0T5H4_KALFE